MPNDTKPVKNYLTSAAQMRAARGLLGWSQSNLANAAGMSEPTVKRFETERGAKVSEEAAGKLRAALEAAGVIFVEENGEGPGVRLRKTKSANAAELTLQIEALDDKIAEFPVAGVPSPEAGMNQLRKALAKNQRTKLKNRRATIKKARSRSE